MKEIESRVFCWICGEKKPMYEFIVDNHGYTLHVCSDNCKQKAEENLRKEHMED